MSDINALLKDKVISKEQYDIYLIFENSDLGKSLFQKWIERYLLIEDQTAGHFRESGFAFFFGRVSLIQDIYREIQFVKNKLREQDNV